MSSETSKWRTTGPRCCGSIGWPSLIGRLNGELEPDPKRIRRRRVSGVAAPLTYLMV